MTELNQTSGSEQPTNEWADTGLYLADRLQLFSQQFIEGSESDLLVHEAIDAINALTAREQSLIATNEAAQQRISQLLLEARNADELQQQLDKAKVGWAKDNEESAMLIDGATARADALEQQLTLVAEQNVPPASPVEEVLTDVVPTPGTADPSATA